MKDCERDDEEGLPWGRNSMSKGMEPENEMYLWRLVKSSAQLERKFCRGRAIEDKVRKLSLKKPLKTLCAHPLILFIGEETDSVPVKGRIKKNPSLLTSC